MNISKRVALATWQTIKSTLLDFAQSFLVGRTINAVVPVRPSPFLSVRYLSSQAIDGAVKFSIVPVGGAKFTLPKGLPKPGERKLAIENEPHIVDDFDGVIESGYGKGVKSLLYAGTGIVKTGLVVRDSRVNYHVHDAENAGLHFDLAIAGLAPGTDKFEVNIPSGDYKGRYSFVTTPKGIIVIPMTDNGVQLPKPSYTLRTIGMLPAYDLGPVILERKYDGSLATASLTEGRAAFRSHRDGGQTYYDRLPAVEFLYSRSPLFTFRSILFPRPNLSGTVFQGELVHRDGSSRVSGILNALPENARAIQALRGNVRYFVWDILKYRGRDISNKPYSQRRLIAEQAVREIRFYNKNWQMVEKAPDGMSVEDFYAYVTKDKLPWGEGIVIKPADSNLQKWDKIKLTGTHYFELVDIIEGKGKYANSVGALVVRNPENGAIGELGSLGVDDSYRNWIWDHRDMVLGQQVKARVQEVTERGAPRAGTFLGFHNSEVDLIMAAESIAGGDPKASKEMVYKLKSAAGWRSS